MVIMGFDFKSLKDKIENSSSSPSKAKSKTWETGGDPVAPFLRAF